APTTGLNYIAAIKPSLSLLMVGTVWSSMLIPLLVVLLFFSTPFLRRQPIFIMNVIAVLMGLVIGIISAYLEVTAILTPLIPIKGSIFTPFLAMFLYLPVFMDTILLFRLYIIYPPRSISWTRRLIVFGPPITFKFVRVINLVVFLAQYTSLVQARESPLVAGQTLWGSQPWSKIDVFFQVFDNLYASTLFLLCVHRGRTINAQNSVLNIGEQSSASKLKSLFYIALGNFVFPCLLGLVELIFVFRDSNFVNGSHVVLTNVYVQIIGVLMATIWVAGGHWSDESQVLAPGTQSLQPTKIHIVRSVVTDSTDQARRVQVGDHRVEMEVFSTGEAESTHTVDNNMK
ncbi:hypothetical protein B0H19DRAFT_920797, partial [Mycena capillaripes]